MPAIDASRTSAKAVAALSVASASSRIASHSAFVGSMPCTYFVRKASEPIGRLIFCSILPAL